MVSGRIDHHDRLNWNHTSALIATIAKWSMHKTKREDVDPAKINPYTSKKRRGVPLESICPEA